MMRKSERFSIFYDAYQEGKWFQKLNPKFKGASFEKIKGKGQNPSTIESLIEYDRPDIILEFDGTPILTIERTEEVPTGHNVGQRFARIVKSAELNVPFVYIFPFQAQKHGNETIERKSINKTNLRYTNQRLFRALENVQDIHQSLILSINWPLDKNSELQRTEEKDKEIISFITEYLRIFNKEPSLTKLKKLNSVNYGFKEISKFVKSRKKNSKIYASPPESVVEIDTKELLKKIKYRKNPKESLDKQFRSRKKSLIYKIGMTYLRSDPYTGNLILYDYLYSGRRKTEESREINLISDMQGIRKKEWMEKSQNKIRKDISIYSKFSDLIILKDEIIWKKN